MGDLAGDPLPPTIFSALARLIALLNSPDVTVAGEPEGVVVSVDCFLKLRRNAF